MYIERIKEITSDCHIKCLMPYIDKTTNKLGNIKK